MAFAPLNSGGTATVRDSAQPEDLLPYLFVLGIILDVVFADRIDLCGTGLLDRFNFGMRRQPAALSIDFLTFFAGGPACKQQRSVRVWRVFEDCRGVDITGSLAQHIIHRSALAFADRIMVRITGHACSRLTRDQELRELGMTFVKLGVVRSNALEQCNSLFIAFVLVAREPNQ